jgi:hypothetical protein
VRFRETIGEPKILQIKKRTEHVYILIVQFSITTDLLSGLLELLNLPAEIRYMIWKRIFLQSSPIVPCTSSFVRPKVVGKYHSVHGCIQLLNLSHQLLNPSYSSKELAMEAAHVFYSQNVFEMNVFEFPSFLWTIKHMPSLDPFDPLPSISSLRLWLHCDGSSSYPPRYQSRWMKLYPEGFTEEYEWTGAENGEVTRACKALNAYFPGLRDVEIHIRKEARCWDFQETCPERRPSVDFIAGYTSTIKELIDPGNRQLKILLHGRRWSWANNAWPKANDFYEVTEDITA